MNLKELREKIADVINKQPYGFEEKAADEILSIEIGGEVVEECTISEENCSNCDYGYTINDDKEWDCAVGKNYRKTKSRPRLLRDCVKEE